MWLAVRIGLHTGPVVVGEMGGGDRHEHLALGKTPNVAARLQALAAPDTVAISAATARLVQGTFALERHGSAEETAPSRIPFLVGRDEEVGLLLRCWAQSKEELGQVVLISGEAGIGKSALVETLRTHVGEGYPRIAFRCSPYHANSALHPVIGHLEHLLRMERHDPPEAKLAKLEQVLQTSSLPLDEVVPLLAALLTIPLHDRYTPVRLSPQQQKQQTLDVGGPALGRSVDIGIAWSCRRTSAYGAMLHMLTFRPVFVPPWSTRSHMTPLMLNRLERPQVEALITHLTGGKALPAAVAEHIVAKTDGVPLFVEELTKMLLESALLREEADHYALTGPLSAVTIPATLQDSLMARLDQLNTANVPSALLLALIVSTSR